MFMCESDDAMAVIGQAWLQQSYPIVRLGQPDRRVGWRGKYASCSVSVWYRVVTPYRLNENNALFEPWVAAQGVDNFYRVY